MCLTTEVSVAKKKQTGADVRIANCVARKFAACIKDRLADGRTADEAIGGCTKALTTMKLLCQNTLAPTSNSKPTASKKRVPK